MKTITLTDEEVELLSVHLVCRLDALDELQAKSSYSQ